MCLIPAEKPSKIETKTKSQLKEKILKVFVPQETPQRRLGQAGSWADLWTYRGWIGQKTRLTEKKTHPFLYHTVLVRRNRKTLSQAVINKNLVGEDFETEVNNRKG